MKVKVVYLGRIKELVSKPEEGIDIPHGTSLNDFQHFIKSCYPNISKHLFKTAVNRNDENENIILSENDEIALLPAFAGG